MGAILGAALALGFTAVSAGVVWGIALGGYALGIALDATALGGALQTPGASDSEEDSADSWRVCGGKFWETDLPHGPCSAVENPIFQYFDSKFVRHLHLGVIIRVRDQKKILLRSKKYSRGIKKKYYRDQKKIFPNTENINGFDYFFCFCRGSLQKSFFIGFWHGFALLLIVFHCFSLVFIDFKFCFIVTAWFLHHFSCVPLFLHVFHVFFIVCPLVFIGFCMFFIVVSLFLHGFAWFCMFFIVFAWFSLLFIGCCMWCHCFSLVFALFFIIFHRCLHGLAWFPLLFISFGMGFQKYITYKYIYDL